MNPVRSALAIVAVLAAACAGPPQAPDPGGRQTLINGTIVTPAGPVTDGWLEIRGGRIAGVHRARPPAGPDAVIVVTRDHVFPAFVDLHNHPLYNIVPRWPDPRRFNNRYEWRVDPKYRAELSNPAVAVQREDFCGVLRYVEVKALVGGTTSTNGISKPSQDAPMPACIAGLARNLDWHTGFHGDQVGNERVRNLIGLAGNDLRPGVGDEVRQQLRAGALDLLTIHLAEGRAGDAQSKGEFELLEKNELLTDRTAIVHGIALGPAEFDKMKRAGASLIWSPRSNMQLYGETTDVLAAMHAGVPVALSPDWSPTGSDGMLDELAFAAAHARARLGGRPTPRELFEMATVVPARMARLDDRLGAIETGRRADVFLLSSTHADPYDALASARTADISLVLVDGAPAYGDDERLRPFNLPGVEALAVCGRAKGLNSALLAEPFAGLSARLAQKLAAQKAALAGLAECR